MNSEKVKEIKEALEQNNAYIPFINEHYAWDEVSHADILTLINELESENERLRKCREVDYKTMTTLRKSNTELNECMDEMQDRIAELEKENRQLSKAINNVQKGFDNGEFISKECQIRTLKQFVGKAKERCHNYYPSIDHYCCSEKAVSVKDIDELLKEYELRN